jgi:hypothetical protein
LAHFASVPLTVDYPRRRVVVGERAEGAEIQCRVDRDGPAISMFMPLVLPDARVVEVEVDMGSDVLILDERFAGLGDGEVRRVDGIDETGHAYTRRFARLPGKVHPVGAPQFAENDPEVMFQSIMYEGLVGDRFLRRFAVTFDVEASTLVLAGSG